MNEYVKSEFAELIIRIHRLASMISPEYSSEAIKLRLLADEMAKVGNEMNEKGRK